MVACSSTIGAPTAIVMARCCTPSCPPVRRGTGVPRQRIHPGRRGLRHPSAAAHPRRVSRVRPHRTQLAGIRRRPRPSPTGRSGRLDQAELAEAFAVGVRVIPVLIDDAPMPMDGQLPADIAQLRRCQFRRLRHREARSDVARLVADLTGIAPHLIPRSSHEPRHPIVVGRPPLRAMPFRNGGRCGTRSPAGRSRSTEGTPSPR